MSDHFRDDGTFPPDPDPYNGGDTPPPPPPAEPEPPHVNLPPWEDRANFTWVTGFLNTIPRAMTAPGRFFTDHPTRHGLWGPLTFCVIVGVIVSIADWIWSRVFSGFEDAIYEILGEDYVTSAAEDAVFAFLETFGIFVTPVVVLVTVLLVTGVIQLALMLVAGDRQKGFEATLRCVAYAEAATILALVPMCGGYVGLIWSLVVLIIGIRTIHGIGTGQALIAVLGPTLLCCCGCAGAIGIITMIAAS